MAKETNEQKVRFKSQTQSWQMWQGIVMETKANEIIISMDELRMKKKNKKRQIFSLKLGHRNKTWVNHFTMLAAVYCGFQKEEKKKGWSREAIQLKASISLITRNT